MTFDTTPRFQPWEPPWHLIASVAFSYRVIVSLSFLGEQRLQFWRFILVRKSTYREKGPCIALPWTLIWTKSSQLKECLEALLDCKRSTSNYNQNFVQIFLTSWYGVISAFDLAPDLYINCLTLAVFLGQLSPSPRLTYLTVFNLTTRRKNESFLSNWLVKGTNLTLINLSTRKN